MTGTLETTSIEFHKKTYTGKRWVPFSKGGAYSPYYADLYLVVNWERDGEEIKERINPEFERPYSNVWQLKGTEYEYFFRSGITWPLRTNGLSFRILPLGSLFGHKGPTAFVTQDDSMELISLVALMNSKVFYLFVQMLVARVSLAQSFEVGLIQKIPVPSVSSHDLTYLYEIAIQCLDIKRSFDLANENSHFFYLPPLLQVLGDTLTMRTTTWQEKLCDIEQQINTHQHEIDQFVSHLYNLNEENYTTIEELQKNKKQITAVDDVEMEEKDEDIATGSSSDRHKLTTDFISYIIGSIFGRWDIRFSTGERPEPKLPDPLAPLPTCSPGMLTDEDGLPLSHTPPHYPLSINWDGILVDDPDHPDDIIKRIQSVLAVIWQEKAEAIEQETCQILDIKDLREYFRRPGKGGFWADHIQRYSKSRRKAPIYWLLQSIKKNYGVWLYYHRLTRDTLFKVLSNYVEPRIRQEETRLEQLRAKKALGGLVAREAKVLERQLERQEGFHSELTDFRDKLRRAADLNLEPDLNDGVVLNIAPLWELVPWNEARKYWEELRAGKYEWSSISQQLREKGHR